MQLQTEATRVHRDMKAKVMAAMETGQHSRARTVLLEYYEVAPEKARELKLDVVASYGITL